MEVRGIMGTIVGDALKVKANARVRTRHRPKGVARTKGVRARGVPAIHLLGVRAMPWIKVAWEPGLMSCRGGSGEWRRGGYGVRWWSG